MNTQRKVSMSVLIIVMSVVLAVVLTACGGNPLQDAVDEINADEAMHAELEGLYTIHAEAQGDSTIVVRFKAELEELATPEIAQIVSESATSEFQEALREMQKAGIRDPEIVLEFLDMNGNLLYEHRFS